LRIDQKQALTHLFKAWSGKEPRAFHPFPQSGSCRAYYRIRHGNVRAVGVCNDDYNENRAFVEMTRFFLSERIRVPDLLGVALEHGVYLIQDLGDQSLFNFIIQNRAEKSREPALKEKLRQVIRELARLQVMAGRKMDFSICYPYRQFSRESILYDLQYFRQQFLDQMGQSYQTKPLEEEFARFADYILQADQDYFMYRDFQSRNIMLFNDEPYFIDYQGGRKGPLQYDLAAFLYQARAGLPEELRMELMEYYLKAVRLYTPVDERTFHQFFYPIVLLRVFQTLGAYGLRGLKEGKQHFIQSIPHALENLRLIEKKNPILQELPQLRKIVHQLTQKKHRIMEPTYKLTVHIKSFSFKRGMPYDNTGHGGGHIFDCRAIHNPGRYERYSMLSGKDQEVIDFFTKNTEIETFLDHTWQIVTMSVEAYQLREFGHLMVSFGCTGGQHRSVYCAERMAEKLREHYDLVVDLMHLDLKD